MPSESIENLRAAAPYELGQTTTSTYDWTALYPVYVRGEAYLAAHRSNEAAAEFQKILDHRGLVLNEPIGALSHLGLARAYAMQGDTRRQRRLTRISSRSGKTPTPTSPSSSKLRRSTRSCSATSSESRLLGSGNAELGIDLALIGGRAISPGGTPLPLRLFRIRALQGNSRQDIEAV